MIILIQKIYNGISMACIVRRNRSYEKEKKMECTGES